MHTIPKIATVEHGMVNKLSSKQYKIVLPRTHCLLQQMSKC